MGAPAAAVAKAAQDVRILKRYERNKVSKAS